MAHEEDPALGLMFDSCDVSYGVDGDVSNYS